MIGHGVSEAAVAMAMRNVLTGEVACLLSGVRGEQPDVRKCLVSLKVWVD